jgi:hypothetical protein
MKNLIFICILFLSFNVYSITSIDWNDIDQDAVQIHEPREFISKFGQYSVINKNLKIALVDLGIDTKDNLQVYGISANYKGKVFEILKTTATKNVYVDMYIAYYDENIVAMRIRTLGTHDKVRRPYLSSESYLIVYSIKTGNIVEAPLTSSSSTTLESKIPNVFFGDTFGYNKAKKKYKYEYLIKDQFTSKTTKAYIDFNLNLKCIAGTNDCDLVTNRKAKLIN